MTIKIKVTRERFEELVSIDDAMNFFDLTNKEAYDYMVQFVVNDEGEYLPEADARKLFKRIPRKEFNGHVGQFIKAIGDAYVSPPSGADSDKQSQQA